MHSSIGLAKRCQRTLINWQFSCTVCVSYGRDDNDNAADDDDDGK